MRLLWVLALASACAPRVTAPVTDVTTAAVRGPLDPAVRGALEAGAADLDVSVRRDAIAALLAVEAAPAGGPWGQRGRFDPSEYVQRAAVEALADRVREPESRALLRSVVEDTNVDAWVRGAAALGLARGAKAGTVPDAERAGDVARITTAATDAPGGRGSALLLAAAMLGDTPARDRLTERLSAGNLPLELWFIRALGDSGLDAVSAPLTEALARVEPEIQLAVAAALLELGAPAGERALAVALTEDEERALEALEYLAEARSPAADAVLRGGLAGAPLVRDAATLALFGRGQGDAAAVIRLFGEGGAELRVLAVRAAGRRLEREPDLQGRDRLLTTFRQALAEADPGLQLALADTLARSPVAADRAAVTALLGDESIRVRVAAAAALSR